MTNGNNSRSRKLQSDGPFGSSYTLEDIQQQSDQSIIDSWLNDQIGDGIQNTQQLLVDWSKWENHVFFHSAEAKANIAIDKVINSYPFDGTSEEKIKFRSKIDGFTKWIYDSFEESVNYANFDGNTEVIVKDATGWLLPELSSVPVGQTKLTKDIHTNGVTVEFWVLKEVATPGTQQVILQKCDGAQTNPKGISVWSIDNASDWDCNFLVSSDEYKSIHLKIAGLPHGEWHHIAFVYHRGTNERVESYLNGVLDDTTVAQAELDDITTATSYLFVGTGISHNTITVPGADILNSPTKFIGGIDELRLWNAARTKDSIERYLYKNIDAQDNLTVYFRFNEPSSTSDWNTQPIVLDYSGNSFHGYVQSADHKVLKAGLYDTPLILEDPTDNKILFPDWPATIELNTTLIKDANNYDRNNPNLITKLVPKHYFEEARFFEAVDTELDEPLPLDRNHSSLNGVGLYSLPGHSKLESRTIIMSFLLVWAAYFDDIKLYIDSFSHLDKVSYTGYEQLPPILINFLSEYYNIPLTNPFEDETLDKYRDGQNITSETSSNLRLGSLVDTLWRRVLVNMPFLLRSRGTVNGIKSLMNTLGLESNSFFRLKEYGGKLDTSISSSRLMEKINLLSIDMSKSDYAVVSDLKAYRHEPGLPDASAAPGQGSVVFQSGDILLVEPDSPPVETQFLSGSWSYEAHYILGEKDQQESLFSIIDDSDVLLVNLISDPEQRKLTLHTVEYGDLNAPNENTLDLNDLYIWDDNPVHIAVSSTWREASRVLEITASKTSNDKISSWNTVSANFSRDNTVAVNDCYNTRTSATHNLYIGDYSGTPTGPITNTTLTCSSKVIVPKFWTKELNEEEIREHTKNPQSQYTRDPLGKNPIPTIVDGQRLWQYSPLYEGHVPVNGWERLRWMIPGLENPDDIDYNAQTHDLIDATQNGFDITVYNPSGITLDRVSYSIVEAEIGSNSSDNKVRIRSYSDETVARLNNAHYGPLYELESQVGLDDRRFSIESSIVHALNKDMMNLLGDMKRVNDYLGAPELEYAVDYPEMRKIRELYFQRLTDNMPYNSVIEFQRWFNNHFDELVETFIPYTADFLGVNFIIESHILERHKFEYKQGDVHVDLKDRVAFSQVPIIIGTVRNEIT